MRIGIIGGTFDPVHEGHIRLAYEAIKEGNLDSVMFIPAANPPHKDRRVTDFEIRYKMLQLALDGHHDMGLSRLEDYEGYIYTIDTLNYLKKEYTDDQIVLVVGSDWDTIKSWKGYEEIVENFEILTIDRPDTDISSTEIRHVVDNVNPEVLNYIMKRELYCGKA